MGAIKVLVVDDEAEIVELLKDWLEMEGYEVSGTTDSKEGLGIFSRTNPDVSIVDLRRVFWGRCRGWMGFSLSVP